MEVMVGKVIHYYNRIGVAVLGVNDDLRLGDVIHILGRTTDFIQRVTSMEIEHRKVTSVSAGMEVALKVEEPVRKGDTVFKVVES